MTWRKDQGACTAGGGQSGEGDGKGDPQGTAVREPWVQDTQRLTGYVLLALEQVSIIIRTAQMVADSKITFSQGMTGEPPGSPTYT